MKRITAALAIATGAAAVLAVASPALANVGPQGPTVMYTAPNNQPKGGVQAPLKGISFHQYGKGNTAATLTVNPNPGWNIWNTTDGEVNGQPNVAGVVSQGSVSGASSQAPFPLTTKVWSVNVSCRDGSNHFNHMYFWQHGAGAYSNHAWVTSLVYTSSKGWQALRVNSNDQINDPIDNGLAWNCASL
jgi:hypothetical protein